MAKLKTNKAAKKRYSLTATGKVKRTTANRRHLLANKTKRQKLSLSDNFSNQKAQQTLLFRQFGKRKATIHLFKLLRLINFVAERVYRNQTTN